MKKLGKVLLTIVVVIAALWAILMAVNFCFTLNLRSYIKTFNPVDYSGIDRIVPTKEENESYSYSLVTDRDLKVMVLTDIHLGGGCWSHKKDMKTIYEVITMLQNVKPDFVILCGDNTFAVPGPVYNGGGTLNNKMVAKTVIEMFEHEGVYFTTVFGNHDTEVFDYFDRQSVADLYASDEYKYCVFNQDFTDKDADMPSVTNQLIAVKSSNGEVKKLLLMMDTNAYVDKSIKAVLDWNYDVIHDEQVVWAKEAITTASKSAGLKEGKYLDTLAFMHIPVGEYEEAYRDLASNNMKDTAITKFVSGVWDEKYDEGLGGRIWYGGCSRFGSNPKLADKFFEGLGPQGLGCLEAIFCGHDHVNNATVVYEGVQLTYCYSMDNLAYTDVDKSGTQRGCMVISIKTDGSYEYDQLNAYTKLGVNPGKYTDVYLDHYYYDDVVTRK